MNDVAKKAPTCCGEEATFNVVSISLQFWFCKVCKNEVTTSNARISELADRMREEETAVNYITSPIGLANYRIGSSPYSSNPSTILNTGLLNVGDILEYEMLDGSTQRFIISSAHLKTIDPYSEKYVWVNGALIYDGPAYTGAYPKGGLPPVPPAPPYSRTKVAASPPIGTLANSGTTMVPPTPPQPVTNVVYPIVNGHKLDSYFLKCQYCGKDAIDTLKSTCPHPAP